MRDLDPNDPNPPYRQLARVLVEAITTGELKPGDRLPSQADLRQRFGLANMTIQRAISVLRSQGRVVTRSGSGVYVRDEANPDATGLDPIATNQRINEILARIHTLQTRSTVLKELMEEMQSDLDSPQMRLVFDLANASLEETRSLVTELASFDFAAEADLERRNMDLWPRARKPVSDGS